MQKELTQTKVSYVFFFCFHSYLRSSWLLSIFSVVQARTQLSKLWRLNQTRPWPWSLRGCKGKNCFDLPWPHLVFLSSCSQPPPSIPGIPNNQAKGATHAFWAMSLMCLIFNGFPIEIIFSPLQHPSHWKWTHKSLAYPYGLIKETLTLILTLGEWATFWTFLNEDAVNCWLARGWQLMG